MRSIIFVVSVWLSFAFTNQPFNYQNDSRDQIETATKIADANIKENILSGNAYVTIRAHRKIKTQLTDTLTYLEIVDAGIKYMEKGESEKPGSWTNLIAKEKARREKLITEGKADLVEQYCFYHVCEVTDSKGIKKIYKYFVATDNVFNIKAIVAKTPKDRDIVAYKYDQTKGYYLLHKE